MNYTSLRLILIDTFVIDTENIKNDTNFKKANLKILDKINALLQIISDSNKGSKKDQDNIEIYKSVLNNLNNPFEMSKISILLEEMNMLKNNPKKILNKYELIQDIDKKQRNNESSESENSDGDSDTETEDSHSENSDDNSETNSDEDSDSNSDNERRK